MADGTTVVTESAAQRDGLFAGIAVVFLLALARGAAGASTTSGRTAVVVIFGVLVIGTIAAGVMRRRAASWLTISDDSIALISKRGAARPTLEKAAGAGLRFVSVGSFRTRTWALQATTGDVRLGLQFFNRKPVRDACLAHGWSID